MSRHRLSAPAIALAAYAASVAPAPLAAQTRASEPDTVIVTARLRREDSQSVPVSLSIVDSTQLDRTPLTSNIQQVVYLVPTLNYVSPNPRNTAFTIRGLGSSVVAVSQANDGLEPGVGFYVDGIYHARPATAAFDFLDLERVEVLRGPQGTLYGKNTTAGAINISSRAPTFGPSFEIQASAANEDFLQTKIAANGRLIGDRLAGRLSAAATRRDGVLHNVRTGADLNDIGTSSVRGQLLLRATDNLRARFIVDRSTFENTCCTQVHVKVAPTRKPADRQYAALAAGQSYAPPSANPFDRVTDIDGPLGVDTAEGGFAALLDWQLGALTLTSISAWRYWDWDAENDRDYTGLPIQMSQHIPSRQDQYSQELRIASAGAREIDFVAGIYGFEQTISAHPITVYGPLAAYWLLGPPPDIPSDLLDGYRTDGDARFHSASIAAFGETNWHVTDRLTLSTGFRYTWEDKDGAYEARVSGGLDTTGDPSLTARKLSILRPQSYSAVVADDSGSGRIAASYDLAATIMAYASYARGYKSGGINMSGLPLNAANEPALASAVIEPERNTTYEVGIKMRLLDRRLLLNVDAFDTKVRQFQANVVDTGPGALRGYLANIEEVRVKGLELDSSFAIGEHVRAALSLAYADGVYESYRNGPCPIERISTTTAICDLSGLPISSQPRWASAFGLEYARSLPIAGPGGEGYVHVNVSSRGEAYGDPSDSAYTLLPGYTLVDASIGIRRARALEISLWARNLLDERYLQSLTVQAGSSGLIVGRPGDARSVGLTVDLALPLRER